MEFITCPNCGKTYPSGYGVCPFCGEYSGPGFLGHGLRVNLRSKEVVR